MTNLANPMPPLDPVERAALKESIERDGMLVPVLKSAGPFAKGQIVDGFNRSSIWKELGRPEHSLPTLTRAFKNEAEFRIAQIDANLKRRQLTMPQRIQLAIAREPWEKKLARDRMAAGGGVEKSRLPEGTTVRASAAAAEAVGLKRDTYEHGKFVLEHAPAEILNQFKSGSMSVDRAFRETKRAIGLDTGSVMTTAIGKRFGKLPTGEYGAVVITPPWRSQAKRFESGRIAATELAALDVRKVAARDAVIVVTTPARWLRETLEIVASSWAAQIVTVIARVRTTATDSQPIRERADFCVVATIGRPELPPTVRDNVVETDAQLFTLVDVLVPQRPGIRLFGPMSRLGWDDWNPEVT